MWSAPRTASRVRLVLREVFSRNPCQIQRFFSRRGAATEHRPRRAERLHIQTCVGSTSGGRGLGKQLGCGPALRRKGQRWLLRGPRLAPARLAIWLGSSPLIAVLCVSRPLSGCRFVHVSSFSRLISARLLSSCAAIFCGGTSELTRGYSEGPAFARSFLHVAL